MSKFKINDVVHLTSITTGNLLPAVVVKISWMRKLFFLPSVLCSYEYRGIGGARDVENWFHESEIK